MNDLVAQIKSAARRLGFTVVGITSVEPLTLDEMAYQRWCQEGFAAEMAYMTRRPDLLAHPRRIVPQAASILTLAINYYVTAPPFSHEHRYGRVARYAWGRDYHEVIKPQLRELAAQIERLAGRQLDARPFVDAVPLLERAVAVRAGLGFFGKNTNLLQSQSGSWFFLAELFIDLDLPSEDRRVLVSCGTCHHCLDACPTSAFAAPYRLDSRRCISYLTIEHKGAIPHDLRVGIGEWIFGCDICQDVCPFNRFAADTDWPEFHPEAGVGAKLDVVELLSIATDHQFRARFKGTPLLRPKRRGLLRNAAIVAANIKCTAAVPALIERIERDTEPLIRSHALWALAQLDARRTAPLLERAHTDPDPLVVAEAIWLRQNLPAF